MTRAASDALTPLAEALALLFQGVRPVAPERLPLAAAVGLVSAEDVVAPADLPPHRCAARDGWAVEAALIAGASPYAPVTLAAAPGWVETGAALPEGADAVLPPDALSGRDVTEDVATGDGLREAGEDAGRGDLLLAVGLTLRPAALPALLAAGVSAVAVRRARIRIVVTGDPAPDAVSPMLSAMIEGVGGVAEVIAAPDEAEAIAAALLGGEADAVFVLGGTGFGRTDRSAAGLARAGEVRAHGIALRPGESGAVGVAAGRPVLLLPGRPEAALAVYLTLGAPLGAALSGAQKRPLIRARLLGKIASTIGLSEVVFVAGGADGGVEPLGGADLPLIALARADGAVLVEPEREGYPEGMEIEVLAL